MQENITAELITSAGPSFVEADQNPDSSSGVDDHDRLTIVEQPESSERPDHNEEDDEDDFEFTFDHESDWFPTSEVFPIFDRRMFLESDAIAIESDQLQTVRSALTKLFLVDNSNRNKPNDEDEINTELTGAFPGAYCVWTPGNSPQASPARCKKSSSTGTTMAKRWGVSLKELLMRRNRSDGKRTLVRFGSWKKKKMNDDARAAANTVIQEGRSGDRCICRTGRL